MRSTVQQYTPTDEKHRLSPARYLSKRATPAGPLFFIHILIHMHCITGKNPGRARVWVSFCAGFVYANLCAMDLHSCKGKQTKAP